MANTAIVKIRMTKEFMEQVTTRDNEGNKLAIIWGEADEEGFYVPIIVVDHNDNILAKAKEAEATDDTRLFPIQGSLSYRDEEGRHVRLMPSTIPWWLAEVAYEYYNKRYGGQQSLERLAERGGFGREELVMFIRGNLKSTTDSIIGDMTSEIKRLREIIDG